ncbi:M3EW, histidine kinase-group I protein [Cadophora sp. MPI-SDFR-AT-0126]|nr:M3EW, histidine kinase-group I protein [Leotiomycetes sp. MPI-SDFR-AT-0126]
MEVQRPAAPEEGVLESGKRDMRESQRALELRKFFAPNDFTSPSTERDFNDTLNNDGALDAYAETVVWRLNGVHAMVSLIDRGTQYFLAGCIRSSGGDNRVMNIEEWFGCSMVPVPGGLCENTLALDLKKEQYPCFVVNDLSKDERFAQLPVVDGTMSSYRFYAGTPITTSYGVNIGSFFLFDDKNRSHGLLLHEKKFLHQQAANVMRHLETKREATERRRVALMSQGIARFLERDSHDSNVSTASPTSHPAHPISDDLIQIPEMQGAPLGNRESNSESTKSDTEPESSILDKIRLTLDRAAEILRESLELTAGGVVFLDTAVTFTDFDNTDTYADKNTESSATVQKLIQYEEHVEANGQQTPSKGNGKLAAQLSKLPIRRSSDRYKMLKVLAMSASGSESWDPNQVLDTQTLQSLIASYPKGNIWYIDEEGYFSSLEQISKFEPTPGVSPSERRQSVDITKQRAEANMLSRVFRKARQIIFLPLWDAAGNRWYSGCFVWSQTTVPVFTVDSEIAYLSAFTSSLMAEISRLDAITSNKMKSDFISSISHEFRSPLHGILASAEFLRESEPTGTQLELISTIQNCGGTLLDTINHVLDYSKINSFEISGSRQGTISNELYQITNLALLCEDIVNGMIAANEYRGTGDPWLPGSNGTTSDLGLPANADRQKKLEIVLDIEHRDWEYNVQPGALRRVVMNVFGNAQKYTDAGHILVQLRMLKVPNSKAETACLRIRDSGRGMSSEYMERKLYHPFAQEDTFAPGVGLGLSIVWSIVNQLGGKISIRSELGTGTDVEITLPVEKAEEHITHSRHSDILKVSQQAEECITTIRNRSAGKSVSFARTKSATFSQDATWGCIKNYCSEWFGFQVKSSGASILITDSDEDLDSLASDRVLVVHGQMRSPTKHVGRKRTHAIETICQPIGPFRLARSLLNLMDKDLWERESRWETDRYDSSTQTPLASPEDRAFLNGIIENDYGFDALAMSAAHPSEAKASEVSLEGSGAEHTAQEYIGIGSTSKMTLKPPPARNPLPTKTTSSPSTITLKLPLHTKVAPASSPTTSLHILAVDDNDLNLQLIQRYLSKRKSDTIITARNGIEAVEAVRTAGSEKRFDVIFMDISMPQMNGFEATRLIRAYERSQAPTSAADFVNQELTCRDDDHALATNGNASSGNDVDEEGSNGIGRSTRQSAYIVALTGLASRRDRDEADGSGFDDFLTKPISFGKIGDLLVKLSEEKARAET